MNSNKITYNFPDCGTGETFEGVDFQIIVNGTPKNLTDAVINMTIIAGDIVVFSTTTGELVITDAVSSKFRVKKTKITLPPGLHEYKIKFIFPNGDTKTYIKGAWNILP